MTDTTNNAIQSANNDTTNKEEIIMTRANKVTITATANGYKADFYRTHKHIESIESTATGWTPNPDQNKSAQREDFRQFITSHAADIGVEWKPEDQRTPANTRVASYFNDEILKLDVRSLLQHDIPSFIEKMPHGDKANVVDHSDMLGDIKYVIHDEDIAISPKTKTAKGADLSTMGVLDGKYVKSGNWAWADIEVTVSMVFGKDTPIYQLLNVELVSGQLKKPKMTQTAWNDSIKASLLEAGIIQPDEPKAEKSAKGKADTDTKPEEPASEPAPTGRKGGRKTNTQSKKARGEKKGKETVAKVVARIETENASIN